MNSTSLMRSARLALEKQAFLTELLEGVGSALARASESGLAKKIGESAIGKGITAAGNYAVNSFKTAPGKVLGQRLWTTAKDVATHYPGATMGTAAAAGFGAGQWLKKRQSKFSQQ